MVYLIFLCKIVIKLLFLIYFFVFGVKSFVVNFFLELKKNKVFDIKDEKVS